MLKKYYPYIGVAFALGLSLIIFINRDKFVNLGNYGYLGIFLISVLGNATIILPVPVILTAFIGGGIFNPLIVGTVAALGASLGELTGYLAGAGGKGIIEKKKSIAKMKKWMDRYGLWVLFILAVIPNPAFDLAGIVAGASGIKVQRFLIVVWLGKLIKFVAISLLGGGSALFIDKLS